MGLLTIALRFPGTIGFTTRARSSSVSARLLDKKIACRKSYYRPTFGERQVRVDKPAAFLPDSLLASILDKVC